MSWAAECMDCWLIKSDNENDLKIYNSSSFNWTNPVTCFTHYYASSDFLVLLARHHFLVRKCRHKMDCLRGKEGNYTSSDSCWYINQRVISGQLLFGILGCCLNLVVFLNILFSKNLRKNVSLVLISNLALGDTLNCIYAVVIASFTISLPYEDFVELSDSTCSKVGFLWVLGQCTTCITSLALTAERYLCIVFSMKPYIRMSPRLASLTIAFNWLFAALMMAVTFFFNMCARNFVCIPVHYNDKLPNATRFTFFFGTTGITLYLAIIPLYVHIYMVVKRSGQQMGVQRESTLAKRIALLVMSNLLFFVIPVLSMGAGIILIEYIDKTFNYSTSVILALIPLYCLSINSCLNPLVHAFRNDMFKTALKRNLALTGNTNNVTPACHPVNQ